MHDLAHLPPELVREISLYLDERDLCRAVLVNKQWHTTWTPYLWFNFTVIGPDKSKTVINRKYQRVLARNAHLIRNVFVRCGPHVKVFHALCKVHNINLTSLYVRTWLHLESDVNRLVNIIQQSPQLRVLEILNNTVHEEWFERLLMAVASGLPRLQTLRLLSLSSPSKVKPNVARTFLETCSSELEILVFQFAILRPQDSDLPLPPTTIPGTKAHSKLKVLQLELFFSNYYAQDKGKAVIPWVLQTFLEGCTGLEIVDDRIPSYEGAPLWYMAHPSILTVLQRVLGIKFRPCLDTLPDVLLQPASVPLSTRLDLSVGNDGVQEVWQSISLGDSPPDVKDEDRQAIVHAATRRGFQRLKLGSTAWLTSQDLLTILERCPTLRMLTYGRAIPTLTATEVTQRSWSCKWLKSLHLVISGIPRPDVMTDTMDRPKPAGTPLHSGTMEESRLIQRRVYSKLGSLVCLEELILGYNRHEDRITERVEASDETWIYNPYHQLTCLELTLESGLDLLSDLKSLRIFIVWNMEHKIGKDELLWMERQWLSIEQVYGLVPSTILRPKRRFGTPPEVLAFKFAFMVL